MGPQACTPRWQRPVHEPGSASASAVRPDRRRHHAARERSRRSAPSGDESPATLWPPRTPMGWSTSPAHRTAATMSATSTGRRIADSCGGHRVVPPHRAASIPAIPRSQHFAPRARSQITHDVHTHPHSPHWIGAEYRTLGGRQGAALPTAMVLPIWWSWRTLPARAHGTRPRPSAGSPLRARHSAGWWSPSESSRC